MPKNRFCIPILLILFLFPISIMAQEQSSVQSVILNESKLRINGTSNVNDFECVYEEELESDTLFHEVELAEAFANIQGDRLELVVESFDCGKRGINRDFRNTLKSKQYPNIHIEVLQVTAKNDIPDKATVAIELAGVTNTYEVDLKNVSIDNDLIQVLGEQNLRMSDFGLKPPTALFGLIKVRDRLKISFTLQVIQT